MSSRVPLVSHWFDEQARKARATPAGTCKVSLSLERVIIELSKYLSRYSTNMKEFSFRHTTLLFIVKNMKELFFNSSSTYCPYIK